MVSKSVLDIALVEQQDDKTEKSLYSKHLSEANPQFRPEVDLTPRTLYHKDQSSRKGDGYSDTFFEYPHNLGLLLGTELSLTTLSSKSGLFRKDTDD